MLEFCTCGSLIINGKCSNKNCEYRVEEQTKPIKTVKRKASTAKNASMDSTSKKSNSTTSSRRNSKCITYSLEELEKRKEDSE